MSELTVERLNLFIVLNRKFWHFSNTFSSIKKKFKMWRSMRAKNADVQKIKRDFSQNLVTWCDKLNVIVVWFGRI